MLPFQIEDANEPMSLEEAENEGTAKESSGDKKRAKVTQNIRLNNRIIDLRVPVN